MFYMNKMKLSLSKTTVLFFYVIAIVLTPFFHHHPEGHHPDSANSGYHSHAAPFASHTHEHSEDDQHEDNSTDHFSASITHFTGMMGVVQANTNNIFELVTLSITLDLLIQSTEGHYSSQFPQETDFNLLPLQPQQDYCILSATNLSPPQV